MDWCYKIFVIAPVRWTGKLSVKGLDLNLLVALNTILEERSLSRVAVRLNPFLNCSQRRACSVVGVL